MEKAHHISDSGLNLENLDLTQRESADGLGRHPAAQANDRSPLPSGMKQERNVAGHELAQGIPMRAVNLAVGLKVDVVLADPMDADGGGEPLAVVDHLV